MEIIYTDLLVKDDDLVLDAAGLPVLIHDRECIAQDLIHMIRELGLLLLLIGDRGDSNQEEAAQKIVIEIENDNRIILGTVFFNKSKTGLFDIQATTVDFGDIGLRL